MITVIGVKLLNTLLSDCHSPIILTLKTKQAVATCNEDVSLESDIDYLPISTKWCDENKINFQSKFDHIKIEEINQILDSLEAGNAALTVMDEVLKNVTGIPLKAGQEIGISKQISTTNRNPNPTNQNKSWFDHECHMKRKHYFKIKNRLRRSKSFQDIAALKNEAKAYKRFINRKRHIFYKNLH